MEVPFTGGNMYYGPAGTVAAGCTCEHAAGYIYVNVEVGMEGGLNKVVLDAYIGGKPYFTRFIVVACHVLGRCGWVGYLQRRQFFAGAAQFTDGFHFSFSH